jgi:hypothetical protein
MFFGYDALLSQVSQLIWRSSAQPQLLLGESLAVDLGMITEIALLMVACGVWFAPTAFRRPDLQGCPSGCRHGGALDVLLPADELEACRPSFVGRSP